MKEAIELLDKPKKKSGLVVTLATPGPVLENKPYEKEHGILINGGHRVNIEGDIVDYLEARIDALLRENKRLKKLID